MHLLFIYLSNLLHYRCYRGVQAKLPCEGQIWNTGGAGGVGGWGGGAACRVKNSISLPAHCELGNVHTDNMNMLPTSA